MIEFYSPSGQEAPLAGFLVQEMARRGFHAHLDEAGNATGQIGAGARKVYLVGHMDTVSGEIPVRIEEKKLYGRGSVDAKGSLAAFIEAASSLKDNDKLSITVIGCVGEEAESKGAKHLIASHQHQPDFVIIGEPSGWDSITLGYKGSVNLVCQITQERHHGGHAEPTAAERAVEIYQQIKARFGSETLGFETSNLKLIALNTHQNGLDERAELKLNLRTPLGFDFDLLHAFLESLPKNIDVEMGETTPAIKAEKQNPLVRSFLRAIRAQGAQPTFKVKTGTSDMNLLGPAWNVPILAYGPGDSSLDHTPHEHVLIEEYEKAVIVLQQVLQALA
ncbi:[LysW]-lysine hydrolase [Candidatus Acetothermia bacterium]|nr:[LysW]-lysine hydrolase [Candidatus Acetothermia bacterium]MBI3643941.1 [LysW]-lysine hydrolase [Candidatus Acetothermia bacterium]